MSGVGIFLLRCIPYPRRYCKHSKQSGKPSFRNRTNSGGALETKCLCRRDGASHGAVTSQLRGGDTWTRGWSTGAAWGALSCLMTCSYARWADRAYAVKGWKLSDRHYDTAFHPRERLRDEYSNKTIRFGEFWGRKTCLNAKLLCFLLNLYNELKKETLLINFVIFLSGLCTTSWSLWGLHSVYFWLSKLLILLYFCM